MIKYYLPMIDLYLEYCIEQPEMNELYIFLVFQTPILALYVQPVRRSQLED